MNKEKFIQILTSISDVDLNEFIKRKGKPPKPCNMCVIVDNGLPYIEFKEEFKNKLT